MEKKSSPCLHGVGKWGRKFMRKAVRILNVPSVSTQSRDVVSLIPPEECGTVLHSMAELDSETQQAEKVWMLSENRY